MHNMEATFSLLILVSLVAFGIQTPLLAIYARRFDGITVAMYRNVSLMITMSPVLLFIPEGQYELLAEYWPYVALSAFLGAVTFILGITASTYLPIGISQSLRQATNILSAIILGVLFFAEYLTALQLTLVGLLLGGVVALSLSKPDVLHLERQNVSRGIWMSIAAGVGASCTFLFFAYASRAMSPLLTGYLLEVGVGVTAVVLGALRYLAFKQKTPLLKVRDIIKLTLVSATAIVGTLCFGFAVTFGPYALASAVVSTAGIVSLLVAWYVFKEKITQKQLLTVLFILGMVIALQFV